VPEGAEEKCGNSFRITGLRPAHPRYATATLMSSL